MSSNIAPADVTAMSAGPSTTPELTNVDNAFNPPTGDIQNLLIQQPYNFNSSSQLDPLKKAFGAGNEAYFNFFWDNYGRDLNLMRPLWAFLEVVCLQARRPLSFLFALVSIQNPEIEAKINNKKTDLNSLGAQAQSGILDANEKAQLVAQLKDKQVEVIFRYSKNSFKVEPV